MMLCLHLSTRLLCLQQISKSTAEKKLYCHLCLYCQHPTMLSLFLAQLHASLCFNKFNVFINKTKIKIGICDSDPLWNWGQWNVIAQTEFKSIGNIKWSIHSFISIHFVLFFFVFFLVCLFLLRKAVTPVGIFHANRKLVIHCKSLTFHWVFFYGHKMFT